MLSYEWIVELPLLNRVANRDGEWRSGFILKSEDYLGVAVCYDRLKKNPLVHFCFNFSLPFLRALATVVSLALICSSSLRLCQELGG